MPLCEPRIDLHCTISGSALVKDTDITMKPGLFMATHV